MPRIFLSDVATKYRSNKVTATSRFNIPRSSQRRFQLRAIGSRYYTRARRSLSQNRLRNDAKSLRGDRTHARQAEKTRTDAKNKAPWPRRMTRGLEGEGRCINSSRLCHVDYDKSRSRSAPRRKCSPRVPTSLDSNSLRLHSRRFNTRYIVPTCYSVTRISIRYTAMINMVYVREACVNWYWNTRQKSTLSRLKLAKLAKLAILKR